MVKEFKNKKVLITGATSGIGKQLALDFAKEGAIVLINYIRLSEAKNMKKIFEENKYECVLLKGDISKYEDVISMKKKLNREKVEDIDIIINNAGITLDKTMKKMTPDEWNKVIQINLTGVFNTTNVFLPIMNKNGRIINVASIVGIRGNFGQTNYSASKAGIIGFTKSLAKEVGKDGITVNAIAPGFVKTPMVEKMPEKYREQIISTLAIPRLGEVADISNAVLFLANKKSSYITGHVLEITGGIRL